jgi:hypothetical protein
LLLKEQLMPPAPAAPAVRRWPMGIVTAPRVPLVYLNLPKCASTTIQNHLLYMAQGAYATDPQSIHQHTGLRRSREDSDETHALIARQVAEGAVVFTFVRDPGRRAYACFNEKIMHTGRHSFVAIRHALERGWGLRPPRPDEAPSLELQRENFAAFLHFVEANLAGDTDIRRDPHWCPQGPMLVHYRQHLKIDLVGKVENFAADMALACKAGVRRIPDVQWRPGATAAPFSFEDVLTRARRFGRVAADYKHLGYEGGGQAQVQTRRELMINRTELSGNLVMGMSQSWDVVATVRERPKSFMPSCAIAGRRLPVCAPVSDPQDPLLAAWRDQLAFARSSCLPRVRPDGRMAAWRGRRPVRRCLLRGQSDWIARGRRRVSYAPAALARRWRTCLTSSTFAC